MSFNVNFQPSIWWTCLKTHSEAWLSMYPETETRVTVLSVTEGFLIMNRFWPRIVLLPRFRICVRCQTLRNVPALLPMTRTGVSKYSEGQVGRQVHLTQCHRWPNPLTVHSTQLHLGQCDTGSVRHTWIFEKPFQLAVGPLKKRFSSKLL